MSDILSEKIEVNSWLPHGEQLRILLGSDHISYGEVATVLRGKGVFCYNTEKSQTIPILSASILRPFEFTNLLEASISRESRMKEQPQDVLLVGKDADWQGAIKSLGNELGTLVTLDEILGVTFASEPAVAFDGPDHAFISYKINRQDFSKDLLGRDLNFEANISIRQEKDGLKLEILSQHSSKETDKINDQIIRRLTETFKSRGVSADDKPRKILFDSFSNKNRILFVLRLAGDIGVNVGPGKIVDVNIRRNEAIEKLPSQPEIKWLEGAVRNMKIDGDKLNDIAIFSTDANYEYFFITSIVVEYEFSIAQNSGACTVVYQFQPIRNFSLIAKSSFSFSIDRLTVKASTSSAVNDNVKKSISTSLRSKVDSLFNALSSKS